MRRTVSIAFVLLLAAVACDRTPGGPIELAVPDRANANVTLAAEGRRVAAAWAASGKTGTDIFVATSGDAGRTFSEPRRVNDVDGDASVNGEQPPRVVLRGNDVSVIWVSRKSGVAAIRTAASSDGGKTFAPARTITPPAVTGARGWESAAFADDGALHVAWLDGRSNPPREPGAAHVHGAMRQDIYHAMWRGGGAPAETRVASDVCFCCKTAIVTRGRDVYVAWRHLFPGGVRDIAIARSSEEGNAFSSPVRVSADDWKIDACPDDGPAMSLAADGAVHVVWPTLVQTEGEARMGIFEAVSRDGGATFSPRARVDDATAAPSHPRIASDGVRRAVVWDELAGGRRRVMVRSGDAAPRAISDGRAASYPAIAAADGAFVVAYTDQLGEASVIRALRVQ